MTSFRVICLHVFLLTGRSANHDPTSACCLKSTLYFLVFFAIGLPHYGRYVSPIFLISACLTFGVHYKSVDWTAVMLPFAHAEGQNYRQLPARRGRVRSRRLPISSILRDRAFPS